MTSFCSCKPCARLAWFLGLAGRLEEALGAIEQAILIAEEGDKAYRRSYLLGMKASFRHLLGERRAREELELATEINQAYRDTLNLDFAAQIAWETGELERAVAATVDQMAWDGGVSVRRAFGVAMAVMSLAELGRLDEASELQATLDSAFRGKTSWVLSRLRDWSRCCHRRAIGGPARPRSNPSARSPRTPSPISTGRGGAGWPPTSGNRQRSLVTRSWPGEPTSSFWATRMVRMATPMRDCGPLWPGLRRLPPTTTLRPRLTWPMPSPDFKAAGWRLYEGRSLALLGTALARPDRARAIELLEQAAERFLACDAAVRRQEVLSVLAGLGSRGRRKRTDLVGPGALSARERQVAALASKGFVAREIAEQLFIGERTVETHLANIYAKLGVTSKLDLIRRASELGV